MDLKKRQALSRAYRRLTNNWVATWENEIANIIRGQIQGAIDRLQQSGMRAAQFYLGTLVFDDKLTIALSKLYQEFTIDYATRTYKRLVRASKKLTKDDTGAFGFSEDWNRAITDYLNQYLLKRAVLPVSETTKQQILQVLLQGQQQGWSIDRTIQELENDEMDGLTLFRARRIVRTELSLAANFADNLVQDSVPFEVDKIWISVHDNRTRDSHEQMDGVQVEGDAEFHVPIIKKKVQIGIDLMTGPGDPEASAGNVINCRCTKALIPKRDKNNRLIRKVPKYIPKPENTTT